MATFGDYFLFQRTLQEFFVDECVYNASGRAHPYYLPLSGFPAILYIFQ